MTVLCIVPFLKAHRPGDRPAPSIPTGVKLRQFESVSKPYRQLLCYNRPVICGMIRLFQGQCRFVPVTPCVCDVYHAADIRGEPEAFGRFIPVILPTAR